MNKYLAIKLLSVLIAVVSQILLKKSATIRHENNIKEYLNPYVIIAYGLFFISAVLGVYSLRGISILNSTIIESLSYVLIPILGIILFKEKMNSKQIIGTVLIVVGIFVFNM